MSSDTRTTSYTHYKDQVNQTLVSLSNIGKPVWVLFAVGGDNDTERRQCWFRGEITKVNMKLQERDGSVDIEHHIAFDDGEKYWFNLNEKEEEEQLLWQEPTNMIVMPVIPDESSSSSPVVNHVSNDEEKQSQKRKKDVDVTDSDDNGGGESSNHKKRARVNDQVNEDDYDETPTSDSDSKTAAEEEKEKVRQFKYLNSTTKKWVKALGLTNAYGTKHDGLDIIMVDQNKYIEPDSFEHVFELTDFLFPGWGYHKELFASHAKPGKPVRDVLRDLKKENPSDPLVSWHQKCGKWLPPTASVCVDMIKLIEEML